MHTFTSALFSSLAILGTATASASIRRAAADCTPPSTIPNTIDNFSLRVNGHSEGAPELEIAWSNPEQVTAPGNFILSSTQMTNPLLTWTNFRTNGILCNNHGACSGLENPHDDGDFGRFHFVSTLIGPAPVSMPYFEVYGLCDADGVPTLALRPRAVSGYESFAVKSFAEGSEVQLRRTGQVGIGTDVTLKIVQH